MAKLKKEEYKEPKVKSEFEEYIEWIDIYKHLPVE